ncbi:MAG: hypothetical protein ACKPKO_27180, partial [Candidatus Fonsibacter sp.]
MTYYGNDYIEIGLSVDLSLKADKSTTYTKSEVDGLLTNKASTSYVDSAIASKASTSYVDNAIASAVLNPDALTVNVLT